MWINGSELLRRVMASAALMRTSKKACGKKHVLRIKKAYRKATRAVLKRACHEWPTQKVISKCKQDSTYVTSQLPLNMTTWGSNGWYYDPCCFNFFFFTQCLPAVSWNICISHVSVLIHHFLWYLLRRWPCPPTARLDNGRLPANRSEITSRFRTKGA